MADNTKPTVEQAKAALADLLNRHVAPEHRKAMSSAIASYVAANIRRDRATLNVLQRVSDLAKTLRDFGVKQNG